MKAKRKKLTDLIIAGVVVAAMSLGVTSGASAATKPITIGFVTFLSGPAAGPFGLPSRNSAELMASELNAGKVPAPYGTKGFGGTPIKLIIADEAGGSSNQVTQYRRLVQQQRVDMVIGYIDSADCLAIAPVAEKLKELTDFTDCGTPRVFEDASYKYVFRTGATATMDNVAAVMYLKDQHIKVSSYAGINQNYAWGQDSWRDFSASMKQLYPKAKMVASEMTKFESGEYGAPISALLSSGADLVYSSYWGADLSGLILQGVPRGLFRNRTVVLTAAEPALQKLGSEIPDGTIVGARGPFDMYAPKSALNTWFRKVYTARFGVPPNYEAYKTAQAILGVKAAYEKAQKANGGKAPSEDQIIAGLTHLTWFGPGGKVTMGLGNGHQAVQGTVYGRVKHVHGKLEFVDIERFPADKVTPPPGVKSQAWIESGFKR